MESASEENEVRTESVHINRTFLVFTLILSLMFGALGGAGAVYVLTNNSGSFGTNSIVGLPVRQHITLDEGSKFVDIAKNVSPSVVAISTSRSVADFFGQVFQQKGGGTGFIISSDGLIATNKHVIQDSNTTYSVVLNDGSTYDATVKATDPIFDFAVLKIDAKDLKPVDFGNSDDLEVGQWVVAIGNALGQFQNTVTTGIISGKARSIVAGDSTGASSEALEGLLQTDAAINPGNSGGPLLNMAGKVVGVNTAVASDAQGIGFSIPFNVLKPAVDSVIKNGRIIRPSLGVRYISVTKKLADANKLPVDHGAYLQLGTENSAAVVAGSPADKAGFKVNDIIVSVNGQTVDEHHSLATLIQQYQVGQKVKLGFWRDGREQSSEVTLEELKK